MNVRDSRGCNYPLRWNGAFSQDLFVVRRNHQTGPVSLDPLRWGLFPFWCKDPTSGRKPINAKAETVARLPAFREAYRKRCCILPVDGFPSRADVGLLQRRSIIDTVAGLRADFAGGLIGSYQSNFSAGLTRAKMSTSLAWIALSMA
jgi:hypothetical protein